MAGTKSGGLKAAATNKARHGEDFYVRLGQRGGKNGHTGGFYVNRELAREAGAIGGKISKVGYKAVKIGGTWVYKPTHQNSKTSDFSTSTTETCVSCKQSFAPGTLTEDGLCPNCPVSEPTPRRSFMERWKPF